MIKPIVDRPHPAVIGGSQQIYRFENNYGASVVRFPGSYGYDYDLYELAVIEFDGEGILNFKLTYNTPITNDVLGHLNEENIQETLKQIAALPSKKNS